MRTCLLAVASVLFFGSQGAPLEAAAIVVSQTLDLTQPQAVPGPGFQGWQDTPAFDGGYDETISEGDTFEFTIDFLGTQSLTLVDATFLWAYSYADIFSEVTGEGTLSLLDASGTAFLTSSLKSSTEGDFHFGQQFSSGDFAGGLSGSLTFWGVRYQGTLTDYVEAGVTSRQYSSPAFYLTASDVIVNDAAAVPEPASLAFWGLGAAALVIACRKQRNTMAAV